MGALFSDLTIRELELFVLAARTKSLRETARQSNLLPAHVSKIMKRLESKLGQSLFRRSASGVILSPEGLQLLEAANQICEISQTLSDSGAREQRTREKLWTIASISFLTTYLLSPRIAEWRAARSNTRFRLIEFTHNDLVAHGLKGAFELAVHIEDLEWTHVWESFCLGRLNWKLYGRRGHPLGMTCTEQQILLFPFVVPTDWGSNGYVVGEDFCPLSVHRRRRGDEAATAETALELCRNSDQLTFVPEILAEKWCRSGEMQEINVAGWPLVGKEIFLSVKADQVPRNLVEAVIKSLQARMPAPTPHSAPRKAPSRT